MKTTRFRQSRVAMLIDLALMPFLIPYSILAHGLPDVWRELRKYPKNFRDDWKGRGWMKG